MGEFMSCYDNQWGLSNRMLDNALAPMAASRRAAA